MKFTEGSWGSQKYNLCNIKAIAHVNKRITLNVKYTSLNGLAKSVIENEK